MNPNLTILEQFLLLYQWASTFNSWRLVAEFYTHEEVWDKLVIEMQPYSYVIQAESPRLLVGLSSNLRPLAGRIIGTPVFLDSYLIPDVLVTLRTKRVPYDKDALEFFIAKNSLVLCKNSEIYMIYESGERSWHLPKPGEGGSIR